MGCCSHAITTVQNDWTKSRNRHKIDHRLCRKVEINCCIIDFQSVLLMRACVVRMSQELYVVGDNVLKGQFHHFRLVICWPNARSKLWWTAITVHCSSPTFMQMEKNKLTKENTITKTPTKSVSAARKTKRLNHSPQYYKLCFVFAVNKLNFFSLLTYGLKGERESGKNSTHIISEWADQC